MEVGILLLDCSRELEERLKRQGFDVASGTVGYANATPLLPGPVYEYDVIIYNPDATQLKVGSQVVSTEKGGKLSPEKSPLEVELQRAYKAELEALYFGDKVHYVFEPLRAHLLRGGILLVFINHLFADLSLLNLAYSWVPNMPPLAETQDFKPQALTQKYLEESTLYQDTKGTIAPVLPLVTVEDLKLPVRYKIMLNDAFSRAVPLFFNRQEDPLGVLLKVEQGRSLVLPEYRDNEYVIATFLNRVLPRIYGGPPRRDILDAFDSPMERMAKAEIQKIESERKTLDASLEEAKEKLAGAVRLKRRMVESNETAIRVIRYHELAMQQEDVALFYLYKLIEAIKNELGGERKAKRVLGHNEAWNLIRRMANASYGDMRHAPKPGEKIKEWTREEIDNCFAAAERILKAYLLTLF